MRTDTIFTVLAFFAIIAGLFSFRNVYAGERLLRVHFMDVGYGDAILVEFPDKTVMLIDSGEARYSPDIMAYLDARDIKKIDTAILTHPHDNHFGGFADIISRFPIHQFYLNGDEENSQEGYSGLIEALRRYGVPVTVLRRGDEIRPAPEDIHIRILHPADLSGSANRNSFVIWLLFGRTSFLFTADIKKQQQEEIMELYPGIRSAGCVQVPHHGGKISGKFAGFLGDKIFVISTGKNKYGKPYAEELEKLKGRILRTDHHGTIVLESDGEKIRWLDEGGQ